MSAKQEPTRGRAWAVLAYTVADDKGVSDPLDAAAKDELKALFDAADFGRVSLAAQVDFKRSLGVFRASLSDEKRRPSDGFKAVDVDEYPLWRAIGRNLRGPSPLRVELDEELNAARSDVLRAFLRYGRRECPADRHLISFYGHAYGPMGMFFDADARGGEARTLRLNDLAASIGNADHRASIVMFRDCFMNTLETAVQLQGVAEYVIASQAIMPIAGVWPWSYFIDALIPTASSIDQARALAKGLSRFLDVAENRRPLASVPVTLTDLGSVDAIIDPLAALAHELDEARHDPHRCRACAKALEGARVGDPSDHAQPGDPALLDVLTMCDALQALSPDPVAHRAAAVADVVQSRLLQWHHSQSDKYRGIGVYYKPTSPADVKRSHIQQDEGPDADRDAASYRELTLSTLTRWDRVALNPLRPRP